MTNDKDLRGRILKTLDNQYPCAISLKMLFYGLKAVRYDCSESALKANLAYLEEKGYLEAETVGFKDFNLSRYMIKLTAKGKDLVEENIDADPGVMLYG